MTSEIGSLSVDIRLLSQKFEQGINHVNQKMEGMEKVADKVRDTMTTLLGVGAGIGFGEMIKSSLELANHLEDLHNRLGVNVEAMSKLEYAAKQTGVSSQSLELGMQRMTRRISEAAQGSGEASQAIQQMGLSAKKLNELRPDQQFLAIADALNKVKDPADRVRLGFKLFDSDGVALLQTIQGGSAALHKFGDEAAAAGATISGKFAQQAEATNAAIHRLNATLSGTQNQITQELAPTLESLAHFLGDNVPSAVEYTIKAFNLFKAGVIIVEQKVVSGLQSLYEVLGKLPGSVGNKYEQAAKSMASFGAVLKGQLDETNQSIAKADKTLSQFNLSAKKRSEEEKKHENYYQKVQGYTASATQSQQKLNEQLKKQKELEDALVKSLDQVDSKFEQIQQSLQTPQQQEQANYQSRIQTLKAYGEQNVELHSQVNDLILKEEARHKVAMQKLDADQQKKKVDAVQSTFSNLSALMNTGNKKLFDIGKAAAIANAIINTAEGITAALKLGPLGMPLAAAIGAAGAVQVATIKSQSFGGGASAPVVTGGSGVTTAPPNTYYPPTPNIPTGPTAPAGSQASAQSTGGVNITQVVHVSTGVAGTVQAEMAKQLPALQKATTHGVIQAINNGGAAAKAVGRRT